MGLHAILKGGSTQDCTVPPHLVCGKDITLDMGIVPASAVHPSKFMRSLAADCAAHQLDLKAVLHKMMLCCHAAWGIAQPDSFGPENVFKYCT